MPFHRSAFTRPCGAVSPSPRRCSLADDQWGSLAITLWCSLSRPMTLLAIDLSDGSAITVTAEHPFWVDGGDALAGPGWIAAGNLRPGDVLRTATGTDVVVEGLRRNVAYAVVYTLTVAKDHTFFVGAARVLVHNAWGCSKAVRDALEVLRNGATEVTVKSRQEAEEVFVQRYLGHGYRNTTGFIGKDTTKADFESYFGKNPGTYHWDVELDPETGRVIGHGLDNVHGSMPHLQVHELPAQGGKVIRIFFPAGT